jgi:hypothetical protein
MKLLLVGTAVIAVAGAIISGQAQAAPAKDPMCSLPVAPNQSWNDRYGCWKGPMAKVAAAKPSHKDPMCGLPVAPNQSWNDNYGCWKGPVEKVVAKPSHKDPMCSLAVAPNQSWNDRYGCWAR